MGKTHIDAQIKSSGATPLFLVCQKDKPDIAELLLQNGANPNIRGLRDFCLKIRVKFTYKNTDKKQRNKQNTKGNARLFGATPLMIASQSNRVSIVKILQKYKSNPNLSLYEYNATPLFAASERGYIDIVKELLEFENIDIYIGNINGYTAIHIACINGYINIVKLFMEYGAVIAVPKYPQNKQNTETRNLEKHEIDTLCKKNKTKK